MNLEEKNARRQKKKELKHQVRQAKKAMLCAGCEKGSTRKLLGEYEETLLQAEEIFVRYQTAAGNLRQSKEAAVRLLDSVGERPADQLRQELDALITGMDRIYHDCTVRQDDMDFQSSMACLKKLAPDFGRGNASMDLMLRSELENITAVLEDAEEYQAPDFFALAYYGLHEDGEALKGMEHRQRNLFLEGYLREHFAEPFKRETDRAGVTEKLEELMQSYLNG